mgnify:CR=1 FL=1
MLSSVVEFDPGWTRGPAGMFALGTWTLLESRPVPVDPPVGVLTVVMFDAPEEEEESLRTPLGDAI